MCWYDIAGILFVLSDYSYMSTKQGIIHLKQLCSVDKTKPNFLLENLIILTVTHLSLLIDS